MQFETKQTPTNNSHLSVVFIPFSFIEKDIANIKLGLDLIVDKEDFNFFDSIKYHKHIENLIINPFKQDNTSKSAFLNIYKLANNLTKKIDSLHFNAHFHEIRIDENHDLKFTNHNYIVLNEFNQIGYFVFGFEIISLNNKGVVDFAECEFFRFINKDDLKYKLKIFPISKKKEYSSVTSSENGFEFQFKGTKHLTYFNEEDSLVNVNLELQNNRQLKLKKEATTLTLLGSEKNNILDRWEIEQVDGNNQLKNIEINSFNISELINDGLYSSISPFINFNNIEKPILLHLFNELNDEIINHRELEFLLYCTIRIKSKKSSDVDLKLELLNRTYSDISFCVLMEGASIIDFSPDVSINGFFNKYFPSFLLLLNQREAMIKFNADLSCFTYEELSDAKASKNDEVIEKIKQLKNKIDFFKFKQVIHSVSFYDEIATFYKQVYSAFDIKLLLEDNESSVNEIHDVLVHVENNKQEEIRKDKEKKEALQSNIVNSILGAIGCLGLFSFLKDLLPFINDRQYQDAYKYISVFLPVLVMLFILFFLNSSKRNQS